MEPVVNDELDFPAQLPREQYVRRICACVLARHAPITDVGCGY